MLYLGYNISMPDAINLWLSDEEILLALARRIKALRLIRNITQAELANEIGVTKLTISKIERGEGSRLETFIRIVRFFNQLDKLDALLKSDDISIKELYESKQKPKRQRASGK